MNERIKELADQANAWCPEGYPSPEGGDAAWKNLVIFEKADLEKFAQLIVRECANISNQAEKQCQHPGTQIMKHFGVTE
jgi:hypothetical protein